MPKARPTIAALHLRIAERLKQSPADPAAKGPRMTTLTAPAKTSLLETDEYRVEGRAKVSGQAQYSADFRREGMLWAAFAVSTQVHAKIRSVDTTEARAMPGVRAVLTGADIPNRYFGRALMDWPVLAHDKVHFVDQYVAAVAADTRAIA